MSCLEAVGECYVVVLVELEFLLPSTSPFLVRNIGIALALLCYHTRETDAGLFSGCGDEQQNRLFCLPCSRYEYCYSPNIQDR
jgi:hypothetical protein